MCRTIAYIVRTCSCRMAIDVFLPRACARDLAPSSDISVIYWQGEDEYMQECASLMGSSGLARTIRFRAMRLGHDSSHVANTLIPSFPIVLALGE